MRRTRTRCAEALRSLTVCCTVVTRSFLRVVHVPRIRATGAGALAGLLALLLLVGPDTPKTDTDRLRRATEAETALVVTVRGVGICTGAPIEGTRFVVTAAHCLLDRETGEISTRHDLRVERDGTRYDIESVIVDPSSAVGRVVPARDAAILILTTRVHGRGVRIAPVGVRGVDGYPVPADASGGLAVLIGHQPVDVEGRFHRGKDYHDRRTLGGASPGAVYVGHVTAACDTFTHTRRDGFLLYPCGMVPGGSGGPVLERGTNRLLGVISSVNRELTWNGVTPVDEIVRLLEREERYTVTVGDDLRPGTVTTSGGGTIR
jgi:hypothetical protein